MRIIEQLVYKITGDNSEFDKSIDKSETKVSKFGSVADKMLAGVTVAAIGMVIKKMGDMVISSATALDRVDKLSQKIGLSRVAFQEWDYILGQSGASVEGLQMGVKTLSNAADEARKGTALYAEAFDKLGVSVTDTNGNMKDQETLFAEVFSALADMENQTERTALANKLLGRSATELAPTLNTSKEAIEGLRQEAHDLGLVYSDELVDAGVALGDNIDRLKKSFEAFKTNALSPIIGLAVTFTDKLLGQNTASERLKGSYERLETAVGDYNKVLDDSTGKTDAVTESMISQARAAMMLALQTSGETYRDAEKDIAKYSKSINDAEKWVVKYTKSLDSMAEGTGYTSSQLNMMTEAERNSALALSTQAKQGIDVWYNYDTQLGALIETQKSLFASETLLSQAEIDRRNFVQLLTEASIDNSDVTEMLLVAYPELRAEVEAGTEAIIKKREAIEAEKKATEDAAEAFKAYENMTSEQISTEIKLLGLEEKTLTNGKLIELLQKKKIELAGEAAKELENLRAKEQARNEIVEAGNKAMELAEQYSKALGESYDLNAQKVSILETTIKSLIDSGLTAEDEAVVNLITQLQALATTTEEVTDASVAAYAEIEKSRMSDKEKALKAIQDKADAFLKAGVSIVDVEEWKNKELAKLQEEQTKKAKEEAERVRKAWEDATFSMLGSVTSIWGSINQVQANQNEEEIQRIKEQNAIAIQAAKDRGATEEEVTALEKSLQSDLNDAKNKYAQEEAERNKALSTLSVILDTAKAIMQIWANPLIAPWGKGLWTGLAASAGAAQIAAINSAPVPSYDVGSIRIPETTQAVVHKDEMILTAPQAEQARREGITISPSGGGGGNYTFMIYLDGKQISDATVKNINSGLYKIDARVVK